MANKDNRNRKKEHKKEERALKKAQRAQQRLTKKAMKKAQKAEQRALKKAQKEEAPLGKLGLEREQAEREPEKEPHDGARDQAQKDVGSKSAPPALGKRDLAQKDDEQDPKRAKRFAAPLLEYPTGASRSASPPLLEYPTGASRSSSPPLHDPKRASGSAPPPRRPKPASTSISAPPPPHAEEVSWALLGDLGERQILVNRTKKVSCKEKQRAYPGYKVSINFSGCYYQSYMDPFYNDGILGIPVHSNQNKKYPFQFILGTGQVPLAWELGICGMRVGEKRRIFIPPKYNHGLVAFVSNFRKTATMVYDIQVVNVEDENEVVNEEKGKKKLSNVEKGKKKLSM